jgi:cysteinyl-tRNA synthetase
MMNDKEFSELKLRAMIVPKQASWPAPEYLHWQRLHEAANEARERVSKFYMLADEIDRNPDRSREAKERQRRKAAAQAIADLEASKTLARAREAVELVVAKHQVEQNVSPEIAKSRDATRKALKEAEQGWRRAIDKIGERASLTKGPDTRR